MSINPLNAVSPFFNSLHSLATCHTNGPGRDYIETYESVEQSSTLKLPGGKADTFPLVRLTGFASSLSTQHSFAGTSFRLSMSIDLN